MHHSSMGATAGTAVLPPWQLCGSGTPYRCLHPSAIKESSLRMHIGHLGAATTELGGTQHRAPFSLVCESNMPFLRPDVGSPAQVI